MMANDFYKDLEELEDLIEDAFHIPLFKGKVIHFDALIEHLHFFVAFLSRHFLMLDFFV